MNSNSSPYNGWKGWVTRTICSSEPTHGALDCLDKCIRLVLDNLNTHNESAFFETYAPEEAQRIIDKIEFHYTPVHASWLNVAEIEIGVMDTECTKGRIPDKETLRKEVSAWTNRRNRQKKKIEWRFTRERADEKLSRYYVT